MTTDRIDRVVPGEKWVFDREVADVFDNMLDRSVPELATMRHLVYRLGTHYIRYGTDIVDLGASRGGAIAPYVRTIGNRCKYVLVERSEPMRKACEDVFAEQIRSHSLKVLDLDLRTSYPNVLSSLTLSILTLMFVPVEYRQRVLSDCYTSLQPGGALIIVEKIIPKTAEFDRLMTDEYLLMKRENGYTQEDIERKRLSLEGVLVPLPGSATEDMLRESGFSKIDSFWRWLNFVGWIAVK